MNYYIQGSSARAKEIKAAFEAKGCVMHTGIQCDLSDMIYYSLNGKVGSIKLRNLDLFKTHPDYKELELPKPHYDISNFNPFDKVLVRYDDSCTWGVSFFGRYDGMFICCSNVCFAQCIPFEGNEHLLGTTDMCDEQYINW
jgi:hypothetical protein